MQYSGDADGWDIQIGKQWPLPASTDAPADTPPSTANFYRQATDSLNSGNFDAAGMMFRKTLETATKIIDPNLANLTLAKRISELAKNHLLTPALNAWATEIRLGGNEAAHEDDPFSQEDAQALNDFCENFLRYVFTLPAAVARRSSPKP
jgi:hypothetical protein